MGLPGSGSHHHDESLPGNNQTKCNIREFLFHRFTLGEERNSHHYS